MKKFLFVALLGGVMVACNDTKTDASADSTNVDSMNTAPMTTTPDTSSSMMATPDTTSTMMSDTSSMRADSVR